MKITAAVLDVPGAKPPFAVSRPLRIAELDLEAPRPGELLVRILAAGVCHSDLSVVTGERPRPAPMALGHEAAAEVLEVGDPAAPFAPGDRVVLAFLPACGCCETCASGHGFLCADAAKANGEGRLMRGGRRLAQEAGPVHHHLGVSAFATHAVVDQRSAVKISAAVPAEIAALFGCAVLTGVGAVVNAAAVRPGEAVCVYGLGGVGLSAVLGAIAAGANPVVAIDPMPEKRALALELGALAAVPPEAAQDALREHLPQGADVVIETVGRASVLAAAYRAVKRGGRCVTVGLPPPGELLEIPAVSLVADAKTLMGSYMGSAIPARDIPRYLALWRAGRLPVERLLTSINPLSEINSLLDALAEGRAVRQIVAPEL
jgi:alcohol dehydrogenase